MIKSVLDGLIDHSQSAFIEGRVDLRKTYDTLEWSFLRKMLVDLGFPFKADFESIKILYAAFHRFSVVFGLQENVNKSAIYMAGISQVEKQEILAILGFTEGKLPFKYLGIHLDFKKLAIFVLPKKVMKAIEAICKTFLMTCTATISKKALVAWEKVCRPIAAAGLNILDIKIWNKAAIIKHLWDITRKKDCLWLR
ncbi:uncharacterized protein [Nicotiana sylvestris]|uniref:Uncharacterized protein LOC104238931 n=1 Tax=Nicotiana sylvestris TaxID=4096 RepID=A0A1U7XXR9_NICSY|nr:PREDICTED: uncharacterized protein LOC104238931 [Nicotiana sylvestris]